MKTLIIGMGEIGNALKDILSLKYEVQTYDIRDVTPIPIEAEILHICYPHIENFVEITNKYIELVNPKYVVVHSSCMVGTTAQLTGSLIFHSPCLGKHPYITEHMKVYLKLLSYNHDKYYRAMDVVKYFTDAGINMELQHGGTDATELMKLLELTRYCVFLACAKEQEKICEQFGYGYEGIVNRFEHIRNEGLDKLGAHSYRQPEFQSIFEKYIGGHCTLEDTELLLRQVKSNLIEEAYKIGRGTNIWPNSNVYNTAKIGKGCSIGQFCEIGDNVVIGDNIRIGAHTFIPYGVTIMDDVFIAPRVSFSNDKHPPAGKDKWGKILVKKGAVIGMGSIILPGVTIGERAVVGAGSVVTKDIPDGEVWYGTAAYPRSKREEVYK